MQIRQKVRDYAKRLLYQEGATPVPTSILVVVFVVTFFSGWITTMIFSFLPKLVQWFGISEVDTGVNVGLISTSIYIGATISSSVWGYLSDKKGIRACIIATSACCVVTTLAFGCSTNLNWAIVTRFLQGCSVGQVVPLKGLLRKVCDESNMALGMSVLITAFSVGNIMGPSIGGFTAFPHETYPQYFSKQGVFGKFPALLPNLIVATGIAIGIPLSLFLLPSNENQELNCDVGLANAEENTPLVNGNVVAYGTDENRAKNPTMSSISNNHKRNSLDANVIYRNQGGRFSSMIQRFKDSDFLRLVGSKECFLCCILYFLFAIVDIGFEQMFPILSSTGPKYKGMGFEPSQVGTVLMIVSIVQIIFQLTVLPKLSTYFGPQKFLIISNIIQAILCPVLPAVALLKNKQLMWAGLIIVIFLVRTCVFTGYLSLNILLNNSVDIEVVGTANGITMTVKYFGKLIAPIACGGLYSWSLRNIENVPGNNDPWGFPFDQFSVFFLLSILSLICNAFTVLLPKRMNHINR